MANDISSQALRGRQKRLLRRYKEAANNGHIEDISGLSFSFLRRFNKWVPSKCCGVCVMGFGRVLEKI